MLNINQNYYSLFKSFRKSDVLMKAVSNAGFDLPVPTKISYFWKFGSLLGMYLGLQMMTGFFLSTKYIADTVKSFSSLDMINRETDFLWISRKLHIMGASGYFIFLILHLGRGVYYNSFKLEKVWATGVTMMLMSMMTAFLGYVLPWGQMSYWGATVITNLLSAIPFLGGFLVSWIWGGFSVEGPTLTRFYSLHFIFPFMILFLVIIHLSYLHEFGSNNPLGMNSKSDKTPFFPYFLVKDFMGFILSFLMLSMSMLFPNMFVERENFLIANPLVTPVHIQPEWYFLSAYAILRAVPKKLGGVILLMLSVAIFYSFLIYKKLLVVSSKNSMFSQYLYWIFFFKFMFLTWIGSMPVEPPFMEFSQVCAVMYFFFFFLWPISNYYSMFTR